MENKHKITANLNDKQHNILVNLCKTENLSQTELIANMLEEKVNKEKKYPFLFMLSHDDYTKLNKYLNDTNTLRNNLISIWINNLKP